MGNFKQKAVEYWQDRLAKFWPTAKGPTEVEKVMFEAGVNWALNEVKEVVQNKINSYKDKLQENIDQSSYNWSAYDEGYECAAQIMEELENIEEEA